MAAEVLRLGKDAGKCQSSAHFFFMQPPQTFRIFRFAYFLLVRTLCNGFLDLGENRVDGRLLLSQSGRLDEVRAVVVVIGIHLDLSFF